MRVVATFVLMFWLAGPLAGGGCLRECPEPAPAASASSCHASATGSLFTGTHDCGDHFAPAGDVVTGSARKDVTPGPRVHVTTSDRVTIARVAESRVLFDNSPPTTFLTPLRQ
jgi:hypothetical protein